MRKASVRKKAQRSIENRKKKKLSKAKKLAKRRRQTKWQNLLPHYVKIRIGISDSNFFTIKKCPCNYL